METTLTKEDAANLMALLRRTDRLCSFDESMGVAVLRQKLVAILSTPEPPAESPCSSPSLPSTPSSTSETA